MASLSPVRTRMCAGLWGGDALYVVVVMTRDVYVGDM